MSKKSNTTILNFALWVFFAGISIGGGIILYIVSGFGSFEAQQFNYLNSGLFPILVGFFNAYISDRKYKSLREQYAV